MPEQASTAQECAGVRGSLSHQPQESNSGHKTMTQLLSGLPGVLIKIPDAYKKMISLDLSDSTGRRALHSAELGLILGVLSLARSDHWHRAKVTPKHCWRGPPNKQTNTKYHRLKLLDCSHQTLFHICFLESGGQYYFSLPLQMMC